MSARGQRQQPPIPLYSQMSREDCLSRKPADNDIDVVVVVAEPNGTERISAPGADLFVLSMRQQ